MIFSNLQNFHKSVQTITVFKMPFLRFFQVKHFLSNIIDPRTLMQAPALLNVWTFVSL